MDSSKTVKVKMTIVKKAIVLPMMVAQVVIFLAVIPKLVHCFVFPLSFMFSSPSLNGPASTTEPSYAWNFGLFGLFFLQHIVMSSIAYKRALCSVVPDFVLYERFIFNIVSELLFLWILDAIRLTNSDAVLTLPITVTLPLTALGFLFYTISNIQLGHVVLFYIDPVELMTSKEITITQYGEKRDFKLITNGVYGLCRHPMQFGFLLIFGFGGNVYTMDRILITAVIYVGILLGVYMEEMRSKKTFGSFEEYKKKVPSALIPFIF